LQVLLLHERVMEAQRIASQQLREAGVGAKGGKRARHTLDDADVGEGEEAEAVLLDSMETRKKLSRAIHANKKKLSAGGGKAGRGGKKFFGKKRH
jgi:hypothetical protein